MSDEKNENYQESLVKDGVDKMMFDDIIHSYSELSHYAESDFYDGASDVFSSLYQLDPSVAENAGKAEKHVMGQMMEMAEWKNFRDNTRLDDMAAAIGTSQLAATVEEEYNNLKGAMKEHQEQQQQQGGGQGGQGGQGGEGQQEGEGAGEPSIEELLGKEGAARMRARIRNAIEQSQEEVIEHEEAMAGWGNDVEDLQNMDFKQRMEIANKIRKNPQFKRISDLMGRFKNLANSHLATKYTHGNDEIVDINQGKDVERLLPSEYLKLKNTPKLFYKDYLEGALLQYNLKGVEKQGRGPMIVCLDCSSSMRGRRFEWGISVAMALCLIAEKQNRAFSFVAFNAGLQRELSTDKGKRLTFQDKMTIMSTNCSGGTNFEKPLTWAQAERRKNPAMEKADIVFITDDGCNISREFLNKLNSFKDETNTRIYGIGIDTGGGNMGDFCDNVALLSGSGHVDEIEHLVSETSKGE
jgi:uncharacterized protein with von Willebrand factor type A (vWA) domain